MKATQDSTRTTRSARIVPDQHAGTVFEKIDFDATEIFITASRVKAFITLCDKVLDDSEIAGATEHMQVSALMHAASAELESLQRVANNVIAIAKRGTVAGDLSETVDPEHLPEPQSLHDLAMYLSGELSYLGDYLELASNQADQGPDGKMVSLMDAAMPRMKRAKELAEQLEVGACHV